MRGKKAESIKFYPVQFGNAKKSVLIAGSNQLILEGCDDKVIEKAKNLVRKKKSYFPVRKETMQTSIESSHILSKGEEQDMQALRIASWIQSQTSTVISEASIDEEDIKRLTVIELIKIKNEGEGMEKDEKKVTHKKKRKIIGAVQPLRTPPAISSPGVVPSARKGGNTGGRSGRRPGPAPSLQIFGGLSVKEVRRKISKTERGKKEHPFHAK